ncbi:hypothetical protein BHE74_00056196, partial [Ensete ventricosum]
VSTVTPCCGLQDPSHGHWWLEFGSGVLVGYWPSSLFSHLAGHATMVQYGGEIFNTRPSGSHTATQMGNGHHAGEGFGRAAYFRNLQVVDWDNSLIPVTNLRVLADHPNCYDVQARINRVWGSYFYFGGPGRSVSCSCKIRPSPGWWVPGEVPPTIKLALFRRVKSGVSPSDAGASSFWIEVASESSRAALGCPFYTCTHHRRLFVLPVACCFCSAVVWFPQVLMRSDGDCTMLLNLEFIRSFVTYCSCVSEGGFGRLVSRPRPSTSVCLGPRRPVWEGDHYYPY